MRRLLALLLAASMPASADTLELPEVVAHGGTIAAVYRLDRPASGRAEMTTLWTDGAGRTVEERRFALVLDGQDRLEVPLDLSRAVVARNRLRVTVALGGAVGAAEAAFTVAPADPGWQDYQVIMWQPQTPERHAALARLGITAGTVTGLRGTLPPGEPPTVTPLLDAGQRWYAENLATDWYAAYHRWTAEHPDVTWLWQETLRRYRADPSDPAAFIREPGLSDPVWRDLIARRLAATVSRLRPLRPLFYNLADEAGIADLAAHWDFDLSPSALAGFAAWLRTEYGELDRLNRQWGTAYADWAQVRPRTTQAAVAQAGENFSAWADFRAWMDIAFAGAIRHGTDAVHRADNAALTGLEGGQIPGTGGWNYALLAPAVDVMEIYEAGSNVAIARAFNPALKTLATSFLSGGQAVWGAWRNLLLGGNGLVLWDDDSGFLDAEGRPGARARALSPTLRELTGGLGAQFVAATRATDGVAVLYSPPSQAVRWLLDRRAGGGPWSERGSEAEGLDDNALRRSLRGVMAGFARIGVQPAFLAAGGLAAGLAGPQAPRVLVLAHALALDDADIEAIRRFATGGGVVLADIPPGQFDGHGARRPEPPMLAGLQGLPPTADGLAAVLRAAGAPPWLRLRRPNGSPAGDVQVHRFQTGDTTLIGLHADWPARPGPLVLQLDRPGQLRDLRTGRVHAAAAPLTLEIDDAAPVLLAYSMAPPPGLTLAGPGVSLRGANAVWRLGSAPDRGDGSVHAVRVEAWAPDGTPAPLYSRTLLLPAASDWTVPFAASDTPGTWVLRATDLLTGASATAETLLR